MKKPETLVTIAMQSWLNQEFQAAEKLLLEAVELGSGLAAHNLGTLYSAGVPGIKIDKEKSIKYYQIALDSGFEETVSSVPNWFKK